MGPTRLLLAAFPPELAGLLDRPPAGWTAACTGVGAVSAAAATAGLLVERRPDRVLFLGTCGAYGEDLPVGTLLSADPVLAISLDELEGRAYRPECERRRWQPDWPLPFPRRAVAVPPAITRTQEGAARFGTVAEVEHLELSGVFEACRAAGVPAAAALGVANRVGPSAHAEWRLHHAVTSRALVAALRACGLLD
jgi:purine-nucleoside phosphorylase